MNSLFEIYRLCQGINDTKKLEVNYHFFGGKNVDVCQVIIIDNGKIIHNIVFDPVESYEKETVYNTLFGILYEIEQKLSV